MNLRLKARNHLAELVTQYKPELGKFQIMAYNREANTASQLALLPTAGEAVCRHFQLTAKFNLQPCYD